MTNVIERAVAQMLNMNVQPLISGGVNLSAKNYVKFIYPSGYWDEKSPFTVSVETIENNFKVSTWFNGNKVGEETVTAKPELLFDAVVRQAGLFYTAVQEYRERKSLKVVMIDLP